MFYSRLFMVVCCSVLAVYVCAQSDINAATSENQPNVKPMPAFSANGEQMPEDSPLPQNKDDKHYGHKMILGAEEFVHVKEAGATFAARIDSGAHYSSLSAANIRQFERDGKKYVRFEVEANDKKFDVVAPLVKTDTIRQVAAATAQARFIVRLTVKVGTSWVKTTFSLADRRKMQYPLLIGRTFLADHAIVDVSRAFVQGDHSGSGEVIQQRDVYLKAKTRGGLPATQAPEHEAEAQIAYPAQQGESVIPSK